MDAFFKRFFPHDLDAVEAYHRELRSRMSGARMVLDCGCGSNADLAAYRSPARQVWGVDFERHPQLVAPQWFRKLEPDGNIPFPGGAFDVVASRWVLEHVREPDHFLSEARRVLRPGGSFVALTLNGAHATGVLARAAQLLPPSWAQWLVKHIYGREAHGTGAIHFRANTRAELRRQARRCGLEVVGFHRHANAAAFSFARRVRQLAILADCGLERLGTDLGRAYMVVVLRKPALVAEPAPVAVPVARLAA
jgi:ubiquinone/menaquinone biosynthesis C-methylase UbiE